MSLDDTQKKLNAYFAQKLESFGATPRGVDYNGPEAQAVRFEQLVKVIDGSRKFSVIDYGSGYGAMFDFLDARGWQFDYYGVDLVEEMTIAGRAAHAGFANARFTTDERQLPVADYLVASAIFNVKLDTPVEQWRQSTLDTLRTMNRLCTKGLSFNMLTAYSDADRVAARPDLFFGDPGFYFDFCKREFSRNVALLHDYDLYDFTILVRKAT
ncbi:MAG TPA: class I SAM-dependent methyltransferase [Candidatus Polarisedimenticolaceae bacterium]|nr:class I SAM-dependent methyltransferase [Candidatus Polarisedimenticolaceae bacterium]